MAFNFDGGLWGWLAVLGVAVIQAFSSSMTAAYGNIYRNLIVEINSDKATALNTPNTIFLVVVNVSGLFLAQIFKKLSFRVIGVLGAFLVTVGILLSSQVNSELQLILTFGCISGVGVGLCKLISFLIIDAYFTTNKQLALAISQIGNTAGRSINTYLLDYFENVFNKDSRLPILAMGACSAISIIGALLFKSIKKTPIEEKNLNYGSNEQIIQKEQLSPKWWELHKILNFELLLNPKLLNIYVGVAIAFTTSQYYATFFPSYLEKTRHLTRDEKTFVISSESWSDIVAQFVLAYLVALFNLTSRFVMILSCFFTSISRIIIGSASDYHTLLYFSIINGIVESLIRINTNLSVSENVPQEKIASAIGLNMAFEALAQFIITQILSNISESYGKEEQYRVAILLGSITLMFVVILWVGEYIIVKVFFKKKKSYSFTKKNDVPLNETNLFKAAYNNYI